mmetsp:Transcript_56336/g.155936  ORF Transcript_56336/g.155936 Transcript_56336/m.155936 type:complete len:260 (-) Transcript_56336:118-897(-)
MSSREVCMATDSCHYGLASLCALRGSLASTGTRSDGLLHSARFIACDVENAVSSRRTATRTRACSERAGLKWRGGGGLESCANGPEAFSVMYSPEYASRLLLALRRLRKRKWKNAPGMPWVFLNGDLLRCDGEASECCAWRRPAGDEALDNPGSLLALICARLDPKPPGCPTEARHGSSGGCRAAPRSAEGPDPTVPPQESACESCVEVGGFRWSRHPQPGAPAAGPAALACAATLSVAAAAGLVWRRGCGPPSGRARA